jgi:hypothetical protein
VATQAFRQCRREFGRRFGFDVERAINLTVFLPPVFQEVPIDEASIRAD